MAGCAPTDWTATDCAPANRVTGAANSVLEREPHLHIHLAIVSRAATSTPRSEPAGQTPVLSEERRAQIIWILTCRGALQRLYDWARRTTEQGLARAVWEGLRACRLPPDLPPPGP